MTTTTDRGIVGPPEPLRPTVAGRVAGIVAEDPMVLQCYDCGSTLTQPEGAKIALFIILSGWHFHTCEGRTGKRRCRECLAATVAACPARRCKE